MSHSDWHYTPNCRVPADGKLPEGVQRFAAIVSYDGTEFCGFQKQKHSPSVQAVVEKALSYVANQSIVIGCAGRTDTGVHASHQVIHFDSSAARDGRNWVMGANSQLPDSVALSWAAQMPDPFHSRFSAVARTYRYVIAAQDTRPAILAKGLSWVKGSLNVEAMNEACQYLLGEQDFSAFRGAGCQSLSPYRYVQSADVYISGKLIVLEITANAFLLHMVRNIAGSIISVGLNRQNPDWIGRLLSDKDRSKSAATASPCGLYLVDVSYPKTYQLPRSQKGPSFLPNEFDRCVTP